jgi:hypothetical protein
MQKITEPSLYASDKVILELNSEKTNCVLMNHILNKYIYISLKPAG